MDRKLTVGEVINGTISSIAEAKEAAILYIAVFTFLGTAFEWGTVQIAGQDGTLFDDSGWLLSLFGIGAGLGGILLAILAVIGQYLLWEAVLRSLGFAEDMGPKRILAFFGQAILTGLCVGFGFLLLIVPGLIFMARWSAAPAYLIGERQGVIEAMGSSWDQIRGNTTPIVLAIIAAAILFLVVFGSLTYAIAGGFAPRLNETGNVPLAESLLGQFTSHLSTVLSVGLGAFVITALHGPSTVLSDVFE